MASNIYFIEQDIAGLRQQVGNTHTDKSCAHAEMRTWIDILKKENPDKPIHTRGTFVAWHNKDPDKKAGCVTLFIAGKPILSWHLIKEAF